MSKKAAPRRREGGHQAVGGSEAKARKSANARVQAYVREQSPALQKTINQVRALVKGAVPELEERMRWQQVGYLISKKDVCGIYASSDHVNLSFMQGASLRDPKRLLEGTGKAMRHIKISKIEGIGEDTIKDYVKEAVASIQKPGESSGTSHSC